jgi:hypothetical protein
MADGVSAHVRDLLVDKFWFVERGLVELKGKGQAFLLKGPRIGMSPPARPANAQGSS